MKVTIDTSAVLAVLLNESSRDVILKITVGAELIAPESIDAEIGNALSAMLKRGRITSDMAKEVVDQFQLIHIRRSLIRINPSLELSTDLNIYAYDAYVLDCAMQFKSTLLSLDTKMIQVAKYLNIPTMEVS
jgi:predicted nucleic acid-binding protein